MNDIDHTYWYLSRAFGLVAYLLLFASVTLGLTLTGDPLSRWVQRFRLYDLHRFLSLVTLGASIVHVLIVLPDRYIAFSLVELFLPFASPYRPLYTALGGFALYLMAVIIGSFYARRFVSYRAWRLLHYATIAVFVLAVAHGVGAGTDTQEAWAQYLYAVTAVVAFNLLVYRLLKGSARGIPQEAPRGAAATSSALREG
jgi:predicted ferric reductase